MRVLLLVFLIPSLMSCGAYTNISEQMTEKALDTITCGDPKDLLLDDLKVQILNNQELPEPRALMESFKKAWIKKYHGKVNEKQQERIFSLYQQWLDLLNLDQIKVSKSSVVEKVSILSAYDVEDATNQDVTDRLDKKRAVYQKLKSEITSLGYLCDGTSPIVNPVPDNSNGGGQSQDFSRKRADQKQIEWASYGAKLVLATGYQNCHSLLRPELGQSNTPVKGIEVIGRHPNNVGLMRQIKRLDLVQYTHPYLSVEPSNRSQQCFDTFKKPLIYDYGGKPFVSQSARNILDLHRNAGSGSAELGIDCSGFVYSALATMGLRLQKGRELRALDVYSWAARSYMDPEQSGMTCMKKITSTSDSFSPGILMANSGHILMVDEVGSDPLGLNQVTSQSQCRNLNASHFDFTVIQSSNSKNGVGMNRFKASDYFGSGNSMREPLIEYQRAHCVARFTGGAQPYSNARLALVRHRKEDPACVAPERVALANESCVATCPQL